MLHSAQVSRRLARRLEKDLRSQRWGFVVLAAETLRALLGGLPRRDAPLLARELLVQRVVRLSGP